MAVVDVVVQADKFPVGETLAQFCNWRESLKEMGADPHLGFFLMSSNWPTTCDTFVRTILKAISSSPMISNLPNEMQRQQPKQYSRSR